MADTLYQECLNGLREALERPSVGLDVSLAAAVVILHNLEELRCEWLPPQTNVAYSSMLLTGVSMQHSI